MPSKKAQQTRFKQRRVEHETVAKVADLEIAGMSVAFTFIADLTKMKNGKTFTIHVKDARFGLNTKHGKPDLALAVYFGAHKDELALEVLKQALANFETNAAMAKAKADIIEG